MYCILQTNNKIKIFKNQPFDGKWLITIHSVPAYSFNPKQSLVNHRLSTQHAEASCVVDASGEEWEGEVRTRSSRSGQC